MVNNLTDITSNYISAKYKMNKIKSNAGVRAITKNAMNFLDTQNEYWTEQVPHYVKEKSTAPPVEATPVNNNSLSTASSTGTLYQ